MFNKLLWALLVFTVLSIVPNTSAAVIERDWKTPGDGLLTYDTVNKREWLDLSQTLLSDQFPGSGSFEGEIRESRYQYVVSQTAPGGLFQGFKVAKSAHVVSLAQSAGIDTTTFSYPVNSAATSLLGNLLGFTVQGANGNKLAIGLINELYSVSPFFRLDAELLAFDGWVTVAGLRISINHVEFPEPPGVMLYRGIPEPDTLLLIVSALVGFQLFRR